jgi:hypothetical protein
MATHRFSLHGCGSGADPCGGEVTVVERQGGKVVSLGRCGTLPACTGRATDFVPGCCIQTGAAKSDCEIELAWERRWSDGGEAWFDRWTARLTFEPGGRAASGALTRQLAWGAPKEEYGLKATHSGR